jgi:hypothetical protein
MPPQISFEFDMQNIGPHTNLLLHDQMNSINIGIYANNGIGKTFISRAFRLITTQNEYTTTNKLLTKKQTDGIFRLNINNPSDISKTNRKFEVKFKRDLEPAVINDTDYIFYVYNKDYVNENLEICDYTPNSDIQGYILGKANIDVTKEKVELKKKQDEKDNIKKKIEQAISIAKQDLDKLRISKITNEYKDINFENIIDNVLRSEEECFSTLQEMHNQLKSIPDNIEDIPTQINILIDISYLNDIKLLLKTSYEKSTLDKEFVIEVKKKQGFIEDGLRFLDLDNEHCPFCKQNLAENALKIIDLYNQYIEDSESKITKKIVSFIVNLRNLKVSIVDYYNKFSEIKNRFNDIKKYLPTQKKEELENLKNNDLIFLMIDDLIDMLDEKKENISLVNFEPKEIIRTIQDFNEKIKENYRKQVKKIQSINLAKNSLNEERLSLNRRICNSKYLILLAEQKMNLSLYKDLSDQIVKLIMNIQEKENLSKIDKKDKVIESLKYFLNFFFASKYAFDEKNFCISFMDESLKNNATDVLSDGEKGIVAFCLYLAMVHTVIEREEDYKRLFFVIDDPISSMDFNFVYAVAQIIRTINSCFIEGSFERFIILTHNLEFMNILMRNKVINQKYILEKNKFIKWTEKLMLPYENHLSDILRISDGEQEPTHTTANSIRHVLETICRFEYRNKSLEEFISEKKELKDNQYIYSLMQDLSHGAIRLQPPVTNEVIINACKVVKSYIVAEYSGQI